MYNRREKQRALLLASAGLLGVVLLAAALGSFTFASPYQLLKDDSGDANSLISYTSLLRVFMVIAVLTIPILVYMVARAPQYRRWVLLILVVLFIIAYIIVAARPLPPPPEQSAGSGATVEPLQADLGTPEATLAPPPDPGEVKMTPALTWLLSIGLAALILVSVLGAALLLRSYRARQASPLEMIAASAQSALQEMEQGGDVRQAILRCYTAMLDAARQQGLDRPLYLTPAEFVQRLVQAGLPSSPVERLTHLFEAVRYSPQPPTADMEAEAVDCLQQVVHSARGNM